MNNSKKTIILMLIGVFAFVNSFSQDEEVDPQEKIQAKKVAFITDKLDLSVEEAQKFWPVYNEHEADMDKIHEKRKGVMKKINKEAETLSDEELTKLVDQFAEYDLEEAKIHKSYYDDVKKVLPIKKVVKLIKAEREFKQTLLKEFKGHGHGGPGMGRGPCVEKGE